MCLTASFAKCSLFKNFKMTADKIYGHNLRYLLQCNLNNTKSDYEEAVEKLNYMKSNRATLKECEKKVAEGLKSKSPNDTKVFLERIGITKEDIDSRLSVIHVTGTKGKGSSCAYCESILRHHGYKTGFYSSPHLVAVRERIRINGHPLSESNFSYYFWDVYKKLEANRDNYDGKMPFYFSFLTVMAIRVFLAEKVDVAIIEVGIGGESDCTNIFSNTPVVGITSLGLDHTKLLGDTVEKIAWQKAGIMKKGSVAITARKQPASALDVLYNQANEKQCVLVEAPSLEEYHANSYGLNNLNILGTIHEVNASVGLQMAYAWLAKCKNYGDLNLIGKGFHLDKQSILGVKNCFWPGRQHIVSRKNGNFRYFIDGAHTIESIKVCSDWFKIQLKGNNSLRVLLFNVTGYREPSYLLKELLSCNFDVAVFCTNVPKQGLTNSSDLANLKTTADCQLLHSVENEKAWIDLIKPDTKSKDKLTKTFSTVEDSIRFIESLPGNVSVLVTGSLHLVGSVFSIIDPDVILHNSCISDSTVDK